MTPIYLDHAATSPMVPEVAAAVAALAGEALNPSSVHRAGQRARQVLDEARALLAGVTRHDPADIIFTSSATEAVNLALRGDAESFAVRGRVPVVAASAIEHACVRETVASLAAAGRIARVDLGVDASGRAAIPAPGARCDLLCLMAVQNETGVVQRLAEAARWRATEPGARWLCDASQALGKVPLDGIAEAADFVVYSSHKVGGPVGAAALAGPGVRALAAQLTGGPQESGLRAGTENVAAIHGFARAAAIAVSGIAARAARMALLEDAFLSALAGEGIAFARNGAEPRAPGFLNISVDGLDGPDLVIALDACGIRVSSGAACSTGVMEVSPALRAMFPGDPGRAAGALRLTPGPSTTPEDMRATAAAIARAVRASRSSRLR